MVTNRKGECKMPKYKKKESKKELSQLDKDCIEAKKMGLTYGQYKSVAYSKRIDKYVRQYRKKNGVNQVEM
jgi:hypothetical protein